MELEGILVNAGAFDNSDKNMLSGLVLATHLLARKCAALEERCRRLEMTEKSAKAAERMREPC